MEEKNISLLDLYFRQIKKFPLLSFEQELDMAARIQRGEKGAKEKLVESNLRLVVKIARAYLGSDVSFLDLIQEGNMGLIHAAGKYSPDKNVRFSTYASWWIKQNVLRFLTNRRRLIRLPHRKEEIYRKIQKTYYSLTQELEREPNEEEMAREIGTSREDVGLVMSITSGILSLDADPKMAGILEYHEDYTYNPERTCINKMVRESTAKVLGKLKERERKVLMERYKMAGSKRQTLKMVSAKMGISAETVRQIELRAIGKIQKNPELRNSLMQTV